MRRSLCVTEPHNAAAGETNSWKFVYTTALTLPKGAKLKFDLQTQGRDIDWEIPQIDIKKNANVIYAYYNENKIISPKEVETPDNLVPQFEFVLPSELKAGNTLTIIMGASPKSTNPKADGNTCQANAQRRRSFLLYIDLKGDGRYEDPEVFNIDVRGNALHHIQILTPSFVARNKRFDIVLRFEDQFGNLTNNAPADTLIELSYEHLRENLNWKLFVPETGFVSLPNLYFNEPGIYRIQLRNLKTGETFFSAPIKCFAETSRSLYWGLLHGESERVDSTENIENCLRHFRDERAYNFVGTSPFDASEETSNELWKLISQHVAEFNEDDRFTTYLGLQWMGEPAQEGIRHLIFTKDSKPIVRQKDLKSNTLKKIYKTFTPKELLSIPSFTMGNGLHYDFSDYNPEFERVVEIYNAWGSSECTAQEGNPRPICFNGKRGIKETAAGSINNALKANYRFGFVAGGLDDRGFYGDLYDSDQLQYSPGLTAVIAKTHSRDSILEALYARSCYATTGKKMVIGFEIAGAPMGSELDTKTKPGLAINRHITGYAAGTSKIAKIEIIRNGEVMHVITPKAFSTEFAIDDTENLKQVTLDGGKDKPPFLYYYLRVTQDDNNMAWSSPIWIDFNGELVMSSPKKARKPAK
jgi:hypothetical protein